MSAFSEWFEGVIVDYVAGENPPAVGTPHLALYATNPTDANTGTEITTVVRPAGRVPITFGPKTTDGTRTVRRNSQEVNFGNAASAASVTHCAIFNAASGGQMLMYGALAPARSYAAGDPVFFPIGRITIGCD